MKRSSFLKTLLGIAIAPKVLGEIKEEVPVAVYKHRPEKEQLYKKFVQEGQIKRYRHIHSVGDFITCEDKKGWYRVMRTGSDGMVMARYQDNSEMPIHFKQGDTRYYNIIKPCKENQC